MVTSFFMALGSIMVPIGFLLIISGFEFEKPALWFVAFFAFALGFFALIFSFRRAFAEERITRDHEKELDRKSAIRASEVKELLQSINQRLTDIGSKLGKHK